MAKAAKKKLFYSDILETAALIDVVSERERQQRQQPPEGAKPGPGYGEGFTARFDDDTNDDGELAKAAAVYAYGATYNEYARKSMLQQAHAGRTTRIFEMWPSSWDFKDYKPTTPRRDLAKAAALILAEIERLDRVAEREAFEKQEYIDTQAALASEYGDAK